MIIEKKLSHGGSDDLICPRGPSLGEAARAINLTASWDLEPNAPRWSAGFEARLFHRREGRHDARVPRRGARRRAGRAGHEGRAPPQQRHVRQGDDAHRLQRRHLRQPVRRVDREHRRHRREAAHRSVRRHPRRDRHHEDRAHHLEEQRRHGDRRLADAAVRIQQGQRDPYPLVVFNHGGPHSAVGYGFNFKQQYFAANGYFVLDTNFRSSTGYGDAFKWATWGAWGTKDGQDVVSGIDYVIAHYPIDRARVATMGHSYGGFMTNWLITQYPDRFAAAASGAGISNWFSDYGTADIYRTKETEFFGAPWQEEGIKRMIRSRR